MLEQVFPYISIPELREIPLAILSGLPRVPASYLSTLAQQPALVAALPLAMRRQVRKLNDPANAWLAVRHETAHTLRTQYHAVPTSRVPMMSSDRFDNLRPLR